MLSFLKIAGWEEAQIIPLAADCSARTYYRIIKEDRAAILMLAPTRKEKPRTFVKKSYYLREMGLNAPEVYVYDFERGYILLEDFGDITYSNALKAGVDEEMLYELAIDTLIHLHKIPQEQHTLKTYTLSKFLREASLFLDWYYPAVMGQPIPDEARQKFVNVWTRAFDAIPQLPETFVLRDYMVDNLMYLESRPGVKACGLLDFQDAVWGPLTYDLVSLLEDARRDVSHEISDKMLERYLNAFPNLTKREFFHSYYVWGAQRTTKVFGIFARQFVKFGRPKYLEHIPRLWRLLEDDLRHPALIQVKDWFDTYATKRDVPK